MFLLLVFASCGLVRPESETEKRNRETAEREFQCVHEMDSTNDLVERLRIYDRYHGTHNADTYDPAVREQKRIEAEADAQKAQAARMAAIAALACDESTKAAIRARQLRTGFTTEQVTLAYGPPTNVTSTTTAAHDAELWTYRTPIGRGGLLELLQFIDGKLYAVTVTRY